VYQLAEFLGVPEGVTSRPPTTDTYSLPQSQEEFYFSLPATEMDLILHAYTRGLSASEAATELGYRPDQIQRAYRDIEQKRVTTRYLHERPLLVEAVPLESHDDSPGRL
jgi:NAD+ synthase